MQGLRTDSTRWRKPGSLAVGSVVAAGVIAGSLLAGSTAAEAATYKVTETVSATRVNSGDTVTISGKLSGKSSKRKVYVQRRYATSKKWSTVATVKTTSGGTFTTRVKMTNSSDRHYRVYKPAERKYRKDYSSSIKVVVYKVTTKTRTVPYTKTSVTDPNMTMCQPAKVTTKGVNGAVTTTYRDGKLWKTDTRPTVTEVTTVPGSTVPCTTAMSPAKGATAGGTTVTIAGRNLAGVTTVTFGAQAGRVSSATNTSLVVVAPKLAAGSHVVTIGTGVGTVKVGTFSAVPPAQWDSIMPASGALSGGETVTVTGQGLSGTSKVTFTPIVLDIYTTSGNGSMPSVAAKFTIVDDNRIKVVVPPGVSAKATVKIVTGTGTVTGSYTYVLTSRKPSHAEQLFVTMTNQYRAKGYNCDTREFDGPLAAPLVWDGKLADLAMSHARDIHYRQDVYEAMALDGITHLAPGFINGASRWRASGSDASGEILTGGFERNSVPIQAGETSDHDVDVYFQGFLRSHGHCVALMAPNEFTRIGVGIDVVNTSPYEVDTKINANFGRN